jgi:hypothetical protein
VCLFKQAFPEISRSLEFINCDIGAFKPTGNSEKTRSNHDVSDLQVGKLQLKKDAPASDLEFQVD